jgi:hypothetical protein
MRSLRLGRIAAEAELLRLRLYASRQAMRAALGAVAALFLLFALFGGHVGGVIALSRVMQPLWAVLAVAGGDLLLALILAAIAMRNQPSVGEREARLVRMAAQEELRTEVLVAPLQVIAARRIYGPPLARLIGMLIRRMRGRR